VPGAQTLEPGQCGAPVLIQIDEPVDDFDGSGVSISLP